MSLKSDILHEFHEQAFRPVPQKFNSIIVEGKVRTAHPALLRCEYIYSFAAHIVELMEMGRESVFDEIF